MKVSLLRVGNCQIILTIGMDIPEDGSSIKYGSSHRFGYWNPLPSFGFPGPRHQR